MKVLAYLEWQKYTKNGWNDNFDTLNILNRNTLAQKWYSTHKDNFPIGHAKESSRFIVIQPLPKTLNFRNNNDINEDSSEAMVRSSLHPNKQLDVDGNEFSRDQCHKTFFAITG